MSIIINNFDVTAGNTKETADAEPKSTECQQATTCTAKEAPDIFQYQLERWERVRAD